MAQCLYVPLLLCSLSLFYSSHLMIAYMTCGCIIIGVSESVKKTEAHSFGTMKIFDKKLLFCP